MADLVPLNVDSITTALMHTVANAENDVQEDTTSPDHSCNFADKSVIHFKAYYPLIALNYLWTIIKIYSKQYVVKNEK